MAPEEDGPLAFLKVMWAIDHSLARQSKRMARAIGITAPQRFVLRMLGRHEPLSAGHLARLMHMHPSTLTGILTRLEARRLIKRVADPADARRAVLTLTPKGRSFDRDMPGTVEAAAARATSAARPSDYRGARRFLARFQDELDRLDEADDPPAP